MFDAILASAVRLLGAHHGVLARVVGDQIELAASTLPGGAEEPAVRAAAVEGSHAQAIRERAPVNIADMQTDPRVSEGRGALARAHGYRSLATVPLLRQEEALGAIAVARPEPGGFADDEIALLRTFADQAVIAIENVRLFTELEARNRDLAESLQQQTATAEILKVISRSPTDIQPVLDAVAMDAAVVCGATDAIIMRAEGPEMRRVAHFGPIPLVMPAVRPLTEQTSIARAILECRAIHLHDISAPEALREFPDNPGASGWRTTLYVPLVREGKAIGAISIRRTEVRPFTDRQIALLQTFADQAVIAIENVRLFNELEARNRDLTQALEQQTSTSEILRVISRSPTSVEPVFEAIVTSGRRLCHAHQCLLVGFDGEMLTWLASDNFSPAREEALRSIFPYRPTRAGTTGRVVLDRDVVHIPDVLDDAEHGHKDVSIRAGARAQLAVPLFRENEVIGALHVARPEPGPFSADQIALLKTFADQAVIAIENVRLFTELQTRSKALARSVDQLTALSDVGRAVSSSLDLDTVLTTIVGRAIQLSGTDGGTIFEYDETAEEFSARATLNPNEGASAAVRATRLRKGEGAVGQMAVTREPLQIPDIAAEGAYASRIRGAMLESGTRSVLAIPLLHEDRLVGGLVVTRRAAGAFTDDVVALLRTFATQSALAIQNARLFRELEIKSRELEVASQHKSEFLASMSHELRTPLNAIIGFSDVLLQGMFGETNEKQTEYLQDILASGQHLLSLINDILDLSKIEAGRMDLDLADFDLPSAVDDALLLMRERAGRRGIALERHVDERLGEIRADQRKVKQVLLNLLSNAVKFTPEGGRIDVRAALVDGTVEISVTDTGIGIAPEDQEAVFEEFRQVGKAEKKAEGTGLGLALCRKFVELHGGQIWVKSHIGQGSTFTLTIPVRHKASDQEALLH